MNHDTKVEIIEMTVGVVAAIGVDMLANNFIVIATPKNLNAFGKVCVAVGGTAMKMMLATKVVEYTTQEIQKFDKALLTVMKNEKTSD